MSSATLSRTAFVVPPPGAETTCRARLEDPPRVDGRPTKRECDDREATKRRGVSVRDARASPAPARATATRGGEAMTSRQAQVASLSAHLQVRPRNARAFSSCPATRGETRFVYPFSPRRQRRGTLAFPQIIAQNSRIRLVTHFLTDTRRSPTHAQAKLTLLASRGESAALPRRRSHSGSPRECGGRTPGSPSDGRGHGSPPGTSRRRVHPNARVLRRTRSGSVLSPASSPPARDVCAPNAGFQDSEATGSPKRRAHRDAVSETTRVLMEARAALEARALELAEETAFANARVAELEADVKEQTRVLELERRELLKERDAHAKTRDALRELKRAASGREAALTFSLDVQRLRAQERALAENEKVKEEAKRAALVCVSRGTSTAGADAAFATPAASTGDGARASEKKADEEKATPGRSASGSHPPREQREQEREQERRETNETEHTLISRLTLDLAGVRRAHAAATTTSASLRAALDAAETRCSNLAAEAKRSRAETVSLCSRDAVRSAAMDALESLLEDARADAARFREAFEAAQADATRLEDAEKERDEARASRERERKKRAAAEAALAEARAVVRDAQALEPARLGEAMGHASAREDALRARDEALERAAALETRLEETSSRCSNFETERTAAQSSFRVADGRARDAEARAASSETRARSLEASLRSSEVEHARRVAALEADAKDARAATEASRAKLESARERTRAAAVSKEETETRLRDARFECVALRERVASVTRECDRAMRDAEETKSKLEETASALAATKDVADERCSRFASESKRAAENFAACAFSLCAFFRLSLYQMERDTESVRVELRDTKTQFFKLSSDLRASKDDVARLQSRNASLKTKLREKNARSEQDAVLCASLIQQSEDAERVSRLRVAYARECERRLAVTEAEKIRLTRALDARGGE